MERDKQTLPPPGPGAWSPPIAGHRWAATRAAAIREGHRMPCAANGEAFASWLPLDAERIGQIARLSRDPMALELQDSGAELERTSRRMRLFVRDDDDPVAIDAIFAPVYRRCSLRQGPNRRGPVQVWSGGAVVALLMPVDVPLEDMRAAIRR